MTSPDPDILETALAEVTKPSTAARLLVGTVSRDLFSPEVMVLLMKRIPGHCRLDCAREVMTALVIKAERSQQEAMRTLCFELIGTMILHYSVQPRIVPTRTISPRQYIHITPLWGSSLPCECRVVRRSAQPSSLELVRFREWHMHTYCDIAGDRPGIDWRDVSASLIRQFAHRMVLIAMRAADRERFPVELQAHIARFLVGA